MSRSRAARFEPLTPERAGRWARFVLRDTVYFPHFLGIEVEEVRRDYARMRLRYRPELRQPVGVVHGGALAALADTVVVPAVGSAYDDQRAFFTIDMHLRYLDAIVEEDAVAEGWVVRRGSSIVYCDSEVRSDSGRLAATAGLVYKVSRSRPEPDRGTQVGPAW